MKTSFIESQLYSELRNRGSKFLTNIDELYSYAENILPGINRVFANYTGHGMIHSIKVMDYMANLIRDISQLSDLDITVLIYVSLLHDIGMVVTEDEIERIKNDDPSISNRKYSLVFEKYKNENLALQECIRPIHGIRSASHIDGMKNDLFIVPSTTSISFKDDVKNICISHNESFEWLKSHLSQEEKKDDNLFNPQYVALLLRLSDLLDIDETRTPLYLYVLLNPKGYGKLEWQQHFIIENKNKIANNPETGYKSIEFYGNSSNPKIHRKLLKYFDFINEELKNVIGLSESFVDDRYSLFIKLNVDNKIRTMGFNFSDFRLNLDYNAVTNLLMGEHIYGDKKYGLRELIQNSIDACNLMLEISKGKSEFLYEEYRPYINIVLDQDKKLVSLIDNGVGMSLDILQKYFLNVGISYYSSDEYRFKGFSYNPIGNYGIGFLACFMLSDNVTVKTKRYGDIKLNEIELEKNSEYICLTYKDDSKSQGTEIILDFNQFFSIFKPGLEGVKDFVELNFINSAIPIKIIEVQNGEFHSITCSLDTLKDNTTRNARLDKYLNNIEASVELNCNMKFISQLEDIDFSRPFVYNDDNDTLVLESDLDPVFPVTNYINNGKIRYIQLPIIDISESDKFNNALDILDDFDDALNKINTVEYVNIFCQHDNEWLAPSIINSSDEIIGTLNFEEFCSQFDHDSTVPTYRYLKESNIISTHDDSLVLEYTNRIPISGKYSWDIKDKVYIKNVYIPKFRVTIPSLISGIQLKGALFNIKNKAIIPNVSRNDVSKDVNESFSSAIGKALHLWILDNLELSLLEKELVSEFIKYCYPDENKFLK